MAAAFENLIRTLYSLLSKVCLPAAVREMSALLPRKGEPERAAEIESNGTSLFLSLLTLQMTARQVISHQTVLECSLLSQIKADKNLETILREWYIIVKRELTPSNLLFILL